MNALFGVRFIGDIKTQGAVLVETEEVSILGDDDFAVFAVDTTESEKRC